MRHEGSWGLGRDTQAIVRDRAGEKGGERCVKETPSKQIGVHSQLKEKSYHSCVYFWPYKLLTSRYQPTNQNTVFMPFRRNTAFVNM